MHIKYKEKSYVPRIYLWQSIKSWNESFVYGQYCCQVKLHSDRQLSAEISPAVACLSPRDGHFRGRPAW